MLGQGGGKAGAQMNTPPRGRRCTSYWRIYERGGIADDLKEAVTHAIHLELKVHVHLIPFKVKNLTAAIIIILMHQQIIIMNDIITK